MCPCLSLWLKIIKNYSDQHAMCVSGSSVVGILKISSSQLMLFLAPLSRIYQNMLLELHGFSVLPCGMTKSYTQPYMFSFFSLLGDDQKHSLDTGLFLLSLSVAYMIKITSMRTNVFCLSGLWSLFLSFSKTTKTMNSQTHVVFLSFYRGYDQNFIRAYACFLSSPSLEYSKRYDSPDMGSLSLCWRMIKNPEVRAYVVSLFLLWGRSKR
jgi:hypothetical protein